MEAPSLLQQQAYPLMHSQLHSQLHFQQQQEAQYQQQVQQDSFGTPISQPLPSNVFSSGVPVLSGHKRDNSGTPVTQPSQGIELSTYLLTGFWFAVRRVCVENKRREIIETSCTFGGVSLPGFLLRCWLWDRRFWSRFICPEVLWYAVSGSRGRDWRSSYGLFLVRPWSWL